MTCSATPAAKLAAQTLKTSFSGPRFSARAPRPSRLRRSGDRHRLPAPDRMDRRRQRALHDPGPHLRLRRLRHARGLSALRPWPCIFCSGRDWAGLNLTHERSLTKSFYASVERLGPSLSGLRIASHTRYSAITRRNRSRATRLRTRSPSPRGPRPRTARFLSSAGARRGGTDAGHRQRRSACPRGTPPGLAAMAG